MLRAILLGLFSGLVVGAAATWLAAIPVQWSVAIALPIAALTLLGALLSGSTEPNWAAVPDAPQTAGATQASTLASRLGDAATRPDRFVSRVQPRLRTMALTTLRRRPGTTDLADLDDPRARAALGDELHTLLTDRRATLPRPAELLVLLRKLEDQ